VGISSLLTLLAFEIIILVNFVFPFQLCCSIGDLQRQYPDVVGDIRAERGAMIAMELVKNGDAEQPDPDLTKTLITLAYQKGLVLLSCGIRGNVIRFLPALTISDVLINEGLDILEACFE
jgi:4-aminobutyrate aminotransferase/(S)-3-amino-2-methylpropionate transaminase